MKIGPIGFIIGFILIIGFGWLFIQAAKFAFYIGCFLLPVLLIATYLLDKATLLSYWDKIRAGFSNSFIEGIGTTIIKLLLLPFTSFYLVAKAFLVYKYKGHIGNNFPASSSTEDNEEEYVDYEEL